MISCDLLRTRRNVSSFVGSSAVTTARAFRAKCVISAACCTVSAFSSVVLIGIPSLLMMRTPRTPLCELMRLTASSTSFTAVIVPAARRSNERIPTRGRVRLLWNLPVLERGFDLRRRRARALVRMKPRRATRARTTRGGGRDACPEARSTRYSMMVIQRRSSVDAGALR
eukprot:31498-Pelagococcus_subviridis.AAC.7